MMLRIVIDLIPLGFGEPLEIGNMEVWNDATGSKTIGNYGFRIFKKNSNVVIKSGHVSRYKRKAWSVWYLIYLCLHEVYKDKK